MKYWMKPRRNRRTDRPRTHRRAGRDVSAERRGQYRAQRVPLPDGGSADGPDGVADDGRRFVPEPGARVRDQEADPGEGELLVLDVLDARADEHLVEGTDKTVHEYNTGYRPDTPVVRAIYTDDLDARTEWRSLQELRGRADKGELRAYDFPAARLGALPGGSRRDGAGGP